MKRAEKKKRRLPKVRRMKAGSKEAQYKMNANASSIGTILDVLKTKLDILERDIKSDEEGKKDYENQLFKLQRRKEECSRRIKENEAWAAQFDKDIGPFEKMYSNMTGNMEQLYANAKVQHAKGVEVLKEHFKYHPMYKRPDSDFSGVPFRPK